MSVYASVFDLLSFRSKVSYLLTFGSSGSISFWSCPALSPFDPSVAQMTEYAGYAEWLVSAYLEKRSACGDFRCEIKHTCDTRLSDIPPVTINTSDVAFKSFKETISFHKCLDSLRSTWLYETSDASWKVDHLCEQVGPLQGVICDVTWLGYLCGLEKLWSDERLCSSSPDDETKERFIFACVLPVAAPDLSVEAMTEKAGQGEKVIMKGLPLLAGHSVLWSFIGKCGEACEKIFGDVKEGAVSMDSPSVTECLDPMAVRSMEKLLECSLTVTLRYRLSQSENIKAIVGEMLGFLGNRPYSERRERAKLLAVDSPDELDL